MGRAESIGDPRRPEIPLDPKRHRFSLGITMNKLLTGLIFSLMGGTALAGAEPGPPGMPPNLAVDIQAPGAVRAELQVSIPGLKEVQRYAFDSDGASIKGGVFAPPEEKSQVSVQLFDEHGELIFKGEGVASGDEGPEESRIALDGGESSYPVYARFGSRLLTAVVERGENNLPMLELTLIDPTGYHVEFGPDDLEWKLPEGFPTLPYSCFNNSLCILEWKPTLEEQTIYICYREKLMGKSCVVHVPDTRRPYQRVAVGLNHTCALTAGGEIFCWGDNQLGQLGKGTPTGCPVSGRRCSPVPIAIQCLSGQSCRYRALAAGGNHTCAVDTNGKVWCWGEHIEAAGNTPITTVSVTGDPNADEVWFHGMQPGTWDFVAIDTNLAHTCALTSGGDVYCFGDNSMGELGQVIGQPGSVTKTVKGLLVNTGSKYKAVATGSRHTCAIQQGGLLDCWGDNSAFQLTGNSNNAQLITVTSKVPLLFKHSVSLIAAGATSTCTENAYDDALCWGSPAIGTLPNASNAGHYLLRPAYATSIATDLDSCGPTACTRTCLTDLGGDLFCGNWRANTLPSQLTEVPDPKGVAVVSYTQVDVGPNHVCAVSSAQDIWCFGFNTFGQFGTGLVSGTRISEPVAAVIR
jgi:alpha-tubulin suppressor-like RCC1 family protein